MSVEVNEKHTSDRIDIEPVQQDDDHKETPSSDDGTRPNADDDVEKVAGEEQSTQARDPASLQDQTNLLPLKQILIVYTGISAALFCSMLDQTIVSTAMPTLGRVFHAANIDSWVATATLLSSSACQPLYGRLSDIFGRKAILIGSLSFFILGEIIAGCATSMAMLIAGRAIGGVGTGGIATTTSIIIADIVALKERGKYQGLNGSVIAIANCLGPIVGGLFTEKVSWRWCFYISIPLPAIAMIITIFVLPFKRVEGNIGVKLRQIDWLGCAISVTASILILLPLSWGGTKYAWDSPGTLVPLILGVAMIGVFVLVEMKVAKIPLMSVHIWNNQTVTACIICSFITGFMTFVNLFYLPQYYQVVQEKSPLESGVLIIPLVLSQTVTSFTSGYLVSRTGTYKLNILAGYFIYTIASGLLSRVTPTTPSAQIVGFQILSGLGAGQTTQITLVAIQAVVAREEMAVAVGFRNFLRMIGSTLAVAVSSTILNNTVKSQLSSIGFDSSVISKIISNPTEVHSFGLTSTQVTEAVDAYGQGVRYIYDLMIALGGVGFFLTLICVKSYPMYKGDEAEHKADAKKWLEERKKGAA